MNRIQEITNEINIANEVVLELTKVAKEMCDKKSILVDLVDSDLNTIVIAGVYYEKPIEDNIPGSYYLTYFLEESELDEEEKQVLVTVDVYDIDITYTEEEILNAFSTIKTLLEDVKDIKIETESFILIKETVEESVVRLLPKEITKMLVKSDASEEI